VLEFPNDSPDLLKLEALVEKLAVVEHQRWSHWQRYLHSQCERTADESLIIPAKLVRRWESQINRSYSELSEKEKESDREQVRHYLPVIIQMLKPPA
jgi:Zn-dependent M32 family carboxypeptidase